MLNWILEIELFNHLTVSKQLTDVKLLLLPLNCVQTNHLE